MVHSSALLDAKFSDVANCHNFLLSRRCPKSKIYGLLQNVVRKTDNYESLSFDNKDIRHLMLVKKISRKQFLFAWELFV